MLLRVLEEQPADALDRFEQLSMQVKEDAFVPSAAAKKAKVFVFVHALASCFVSHARSLAL